MSDYILIAGSVFALIAAVAFCCLIVSPPETGEEIKDWHIK